MTCTLELLFVAGRRKWYLVGVEATTEQLRRAKEGRQDAFDELYGRYAGRLLAYIRLRMGRDLRGRMESRDILQATLLKSFTHFQDLKGTGQASMMAWLARIAEHEIRDRADYLHRQRRDAVREVPIETDAELPAPVRSALTRAILSEQAQRIEAALETLEPPHREVILLRKFEEMSFAEIAQRMGRSEDACRMLLARAMTALTLALSQEAGL